MAAKVMDMFDSINAILNNQKFAEQESEKIQNLENYIDEMNYEITNFLQKCARLPNANSADRKRFAQMIRITENMENLSDECCSMSHTLVKYVENKNSKENRKKELSDYIESVRIFFEQTSLSFTLGLNAEERKRGAKIEEQIDETKKELKKDSRKRLENGGDVKQELQFIDLVRKIERAGDCVYSIVQAL